MDVWLRCRNRFINLNGNGEIWFSPTDYRNRTRWIMHVNTFGGEKTIELEESDYKEIVRHLHLELNPFYTIKEEI